MKVLLRIRGDVREYPGGDYIHLLRTREILEELGFECIVAPGLSPMPDGVDVVHLFNTTRIHETYLQFREAKRRNIPVVLTPIWHSMREMKRFYSMLYKLPLFPIWKYMAAKELYYARRSRQPLLAGATLGYRRLQREVIGGVDMVAPNSRAELAIIRRELRVEARAARVTFPFIHAAPAPPGQPAMAAADRRDILCAGRIEPRKNQLSVIHAFKSLGKTGHRLLLFGAMSAAHPRYERAVRRELEPGWVEYRGHVPSEDLTAACRRAKAAILASYFETCGFSALEAITCGARVCISDTLYTREIYNGHALFCDPFSVASIAAAIRTALETAPPDCNGFLHAFSRETALRETREMYACLTTS